MKIDFTVPSSVAPAWQAVVVRGGEQVWQAGDEGLLFDVASLTKVLATGTLAAQLVAEGRLELDAPAARWLPEMAAGGKEKVTVRQLLAHASGLPWWRPWYERAMVDPVAGQAFLPPAERPRDLSAPFARGREIVRAALRDEPLEAPPGSRAVYGDPGFIALGFLLEQAGGAPLDRLFAERVAGPLGLRNTFFVGEGRIATGLGPCTGRRYAPTEDCPHRHEVNQGTVNDDNAWTLGGVAGHAGLFATAADVAAVGGEWLAALEGQGRLLDPAVAREFARRDATPGSDRALAWDTPSGATTSIGSVLGRGPLGAIGHLGYTGCSLWIDRDRRLVCALVTNHVHPGGRRPAEILALRRAFHDAVAAATG